MEVHSRGSCGVQTFRCRSCHCFSSMLSWRGRVSAFMRRLTAKKADVSTCQCETRECAAEVMCRFKKTCTCFPSRSLFCSPSLPPGMEVHSRGSCGVQTFRCRSCHCFSSMLSWRGRVSAFMRRLTAKKADVSTVI